MKRELIPNYASDPVRVAAKAGFLTKRVWVEFFGGGECDWERRRWQNRRWKKLMSCGIFKPIPDSELVTPVVMLTDAGQSHATKAGHDPVWPPSLANRAHDEELVRFALFLERQGWLSHWMTEQELKLSNRGQRFFQNQVRADKIPDLVLEWQTPKEKVLWAVELERTRKNSTRYNEMIGAYKGISRIDLVLVITATDSIEANIMNAQAKMGYPQAQRPMLFASMNQVIQDPSSCELRHGSKRITLGKMAQAITGKELLKNAVHGKTSDPEHGPAWVNPKAAA